MLYISPVLDISIKVRIAGAALDISFEGVIDKIVCKER